MYSVMLVDDERTLREGMRKYIPWDKCGFRVAAEADNGAKALEWLRRHDVDVLFLDIRMPGMSGLELMAELSARQWGGTVVVLSGYNDFEYARAAIRYQAAEYLLKPVEVEEVVQLLGRIHEQLSEKERLARERDDRHLRMLEVELMHTVSGGSESAERAEARSRLSHQFAETMLRFVVFGTRAGIGEEPIRAMAGQFRELAGVHEAIVIERNPHGCYAVLVFDRHTFDHGAFAAACEQLDREHEQVDGVVLSPALPLDRLFPILFQAATGAAEQALFYSAGKPEPLERYMQTAKFGDYSLHEDELHHAAAHARAGDWEAVQRQLSDIYFAVRAHPVYRADSVRRAYFGLLEQAKEVACDTVGHGSTRQVAPIASRLDEACTLRGVHRAACDMLEEMIRRRELRLNDPKRRIVKEIRRYVQEHIAGEVLLSDLAARYAITSEYLSVLFKKEEGKNFNQYLKEARIAKAMEILSADCTVRVYELAHRVGYSDPRHFSKLFKEMTGMTPTEYVEHVERH